LARVENGGPGVGDPLKETSSQAQAKLAEMGRQVQASLPRAAHPVVTATAEEVEAGAVGSQDGLGRQPCAGVGDRGRGRSCRRGPAPPGWAGLMLKLVHKPMGMVVTVLGGLAASVMFRRVWKLVHGEE
jgi:hypothetical protein